MVVRRPAGSSGAIQTNNGAAGFGGITPGAGVAAFLATPIGGIPATWLQSGAAVANLGFTPPSNTRTVAGTGMLAGGGDLSADRTLNLAAIAGNSVVANIIASSAVPTAVALPSCPDTGGNRLNYSSGVFACGTSSSGGGGSPGGSSGQIQWNNAGAFDGMTAGNGLSIDTTNKKLNLTVPLSDKTGADYTILDTDGGKTFLVAAHTYTVPQAGTTGFGTGYGVCFVNNGTSGNATVSSTTSVFKGAPGATTSMTLRPGAWACPTSDATNYQTVFGSLDGADLTAATVTSAKLASKSGNGTTVVTTTGAQTSGKCVTIDANGNHVADASACGGAGASPGGSSGDIQYNNAGAFGGRAPSGNGTSVVTTTGAQTSGRCVEIDANGNHIAAAAGCSSGSAGYGNLTFTTAANTFSGTAVYMGAGLANTSTTNARPIPVPYNMTVDKLYCWVGAAPGAGITWTFTLNVDGSDNINQQVAATNATDYSTGTDTPVSLTRGQKLVIHLTVSSGTPGVYGTCSMRTQAS